VTDDYMADHWRWRRGWRPGRRKYTWHFTFEGKQEVHDLAASYHARLAALPGLDVIPAQWLHLTTQGVGFTEEVSEGEVAALLDASARRLQGFAVQRVTLGPARVTPEAILLDVSPADTLSAIRRELRQAISDVLGQARLTGEDEWAPHVSVAYSHGTGPQAPFKGAIDGGETADTVISTVQLIVLGRDRRLYEWTTRGGVRLAPGADDDRGSAGHPTMMQNGCPAGSA
jgi:2'-5' RNA ligase